MQAKQDMANEIVETKAIEQVNDSLYKGTYDIIDNARQEVVVYVNKHSDLMFWHIGHYINEDMGYKQYSAYGSKILATLSQRLTARYGKGYTYTAVTRMMKVGTDGIIIDWKYKEKPYYDNTDYARDTWDAMTDGQYGDMPEGFDGDYDWLGY